MMYVDFFSISVFQLLSCIPLSLALHDIPGHDAVFIIGW